MVVAGRSDVELVAYNVSGGSERLNVPPAKDQNVSRASEVVACVVGLLLSARQGEAMVHRVGSMGDLVM